MASIQINILYIYIIKNIKGKTMYATCTPDLFVVVKSRMLVDLKFTADTG